MKACGSSEYERRLINFAIAIIAAVYTVAPVANYYLYSFGITFLNLSIFSLASVFFYILFFSIIKSKTGLFFFPNTLYLLLISLVPFLLLTMISFFYSEHIEYALSKLISLICNVVILFWIASQFNEKVLSLYVKTTIVFSLALGALYPYFYSGLFQSAPDISTDNIAVYLTSGSLLAFSGVLLIIFKPFKKVNALWLVIIYAEIIFTGARGPLIFLAICHIFHNVVIMRKLSTFFLLIPAVIITLVYIVTSDSGDSLVSRTIWRFSLIFDGDSGARLEYWARYYESFTDITQLLFGSGLGSYGVIAFGPGVRDYPHNLFIGIMADSGLFGILSFLVFMFVLIRLLLLNRVNKYFIILMLPFLELQKSFTYAEYRLFWISIALILFLAIRQRDFKEL
ncbi:O-antigen ligase family protein [Kangiella sp.]|uniref:O-antigen ligase family protein n=1 Tax=Kangiella sp. TaxID=1920245 RepID=UPI003A94F7B3